MVDDDICRIIFAFIHDMLTVTCRMKNLQIFWVTVTREKSWLLVTLRDIGTLHSACLHVMQGPFTKHVIHFTGHNYGQPPSNVTRCRHEYCILQIHDNVRMCRREARDFVPYCIWANSMQTLPTRDVILDMSSCNTTHTHVIKDDPLRR